MILRQVRIWIDTNTQYVFYIDAPGECDEHGPLKMCKDEKWSDASLIAENVETFDIWYHAWHPRVDRRIVTAFYMFKDDRRVMIREFDVDKKTFGDEIEFADPLTPWPCVDGACKEDVDHKHMRSISGIASATLGKYYVSVREEPVV